MNRQRQAREGGFTLLETLVAMVVLGLVTAGLAQGLRFGLAAWNHQAASIERDGAMDAVQRTVRELIETMATGDDPAYPAIVGGKERLVFSGRLPAGAPGERLRQADLVLERDSRGQFVLTWTSHLHAKRLAPETPRRTILLHNVADLTITYFRSARQAATTGKPAGWISSWAGNQPPSLVRLHLGFAGRAAQWPDIIASPMQSSGTE